MAVGMKGESRPSGPAAGSAALEMLRRLAFAKHVSPPELSAQIQLALEQEYS